MPATVYTSYPLNYFNGYTELRHVKSSINNDFITVANRTHVPNAVMLLIKASDNGFLCDTYMNVTVRPEPLMVMIFGNFDRVDHFW